jgi:hypothetical protein
VGVSVEEDGGGDDDSGIVVNYSSKCFAHNNDDIDGRNQQ